MSSIYKKGRDGYFYYQTYVRNSETGKKDKRIFHALGTKNKKEAEALKQKFDQKYKGSDVKKKIGKKRKFFLFGLIFLSSIWFFLYSSKEKSKKIKQKTYIISEIDSLKRFSKPIKSNLAGLNRIVDTVKFDSLSLKENLGYDNSSFSKKDKNFKIKFPNYEIQRIESLSDIFDQGKIHITVEKSVGRYDLRALCSKIREEYSQYSNIIICVYTNNKIGLALANGSQFEIANNLKKENWLALYSYHSVEGEYFDENPGGYLSGY